MRGQKNGDKIIKRDTLSIRNNIEIKDERKKKKMNIELKKIERNALIEFLKDQSKDKDEILYDLLKDDELKEEYPKKLPPVRKVVYKSDRELHPEKYANEKSCNNCRYYKNMKCSSKLFGGEVLKAIEGCMEKDYKYWEPKDNG